MTKLLLRQLKFSDMPILFIFRLYEEQNSLQ
jgi:hypothetical protein